MLLAIDIGNTNIVAGIFKGSRLVKKKFIPARPTFSYAQCERKLRKIPHKDKLDAVIISSVAPKSLRNVNRFLKKTFGNNVYVLGENIRAPIKNLYKKPCEVGQDRLANAVALYNKYKGGIIVDFGTAVTFDIVSSKNEYLGGIIFPGIRLSLENLSLRAALLPKIKLKSVTSLLGRDTVTSMRSGILNGYAALCDGIISKLKSGYGKNLPVIATGGDAPLLAKYSSLIDKVDPDLTLKGLLITYKKLKKLLDKPK